MFRPACQSEGGHFSDLQHAPSTLHHPNQGWAHSWGGCALGCCVHIVTFTKVVFRNCCGWGQAELGAVFFVEMFTNFCWKNWTFLWCSSGKCSKDANTSLASGGGSRSFVVFVTCIVVFVTFTFIVVFVTFIERNLFKDIGERCAEDGGDGGDAGIEGCWWERDPGSIGKQDRWWAIVMGLMCCAMLFEMAKKLQPEAECFHWNFDVNWCVTMCFSTQQKLLKAPAQLDCFCFFRRRWKQRPPLLSGRRHRGFPSPRRQSGRPPGSGGGFRFFRLFVVWGGIKRC